MNEVDIFSSLSVTARSIISQLLESNETLHQDHHLLNIINKKSLNSTYSSSNRDKNRSPMLLLSSVT